MSEPPIVWCNADRFAQLCEIEAEYERLTHTPDEVESEGLRFIWHILTKIPRAPFPPRLDDPVWHAERVRCARIENLLHAVADLIDGKDFVETMKLQVGIDIGRSE
jgi:hypothetical protein